MTTRRAGLVWNERYAWHDQGPSAGPLPAGGWLQPERHAESPDTKRRIRNLLDASGFISELEPLAARPATVDEVCRFHDPGYVQRIAELSAAHGGDAGFGSMFSSGGYEIALLSAGGCIVAVDAVMEGEVDVAYALVRPPGHHATRSSGMGFCLFGNVAVATHHARAARGVGRVGIVDWDVHHGNGTQEAFYADPSVLTISIHQDAAFPADGGTLDERGEGAGYGANINIPLPPGCGRGAYDATLERVVVPAIRRHEPDLIIVACGYDGSGFDPLGRMMLHSGVYRDMTTVLLELADEVCDGRLVVCHEGGYSAAVVPFCGLAVVEALVGHRSWVDDPFEPLIASMGGQALQPHQQAVIEIAAAAVRDVPRAS